MENYVFTVLEQSKWHSAQFIGYCFQYIRDILLNLLWPIENWTYSPLCKVFRSKFFEVEKVGYDVRSVDEYK